MKAVRIVIEYVILLVFPLAMLVGGFMDLFTLTIPNRISLALIAGFIVAALITGMPLATFGSHVLTGLAVLALGIALFAGGYVGGGDAKLLAAAALWLGHTQVMPYIVLVAVAGGLLAILILLYRQIILPPYLMQQEWAQRLHNKTSGIPYGVALAAAALWIYPKTGWFAGIAT